MSKIIIVTRKGKIKKMDSSSIREQGRNTQGVLGIRINDEDDCVAQDEERVPSKEEEGRLRIVLAGAHEFHERGGARLKHHALFGGFCHEAHDEDGNECREGAKGCGTQDGSLWGGVVSGYCRFLFHSSSRILPFRTNSG